jgi:hypothetical protein
MATLQRRESLVDAPPSIVVPFGERIGVGVGGGA